MTGSSNQPLLAGVDDDEGNEKLASKVRIESKKLWPIVGPSIFSRLSAYSMNPITQAFAGHLGNIELAAVSISVTVIAGFNYDFLLGMASALETLCGQPFVRDIRAEIMDCLMLVLFLAILFRWCQNHAYNTLYIFATPILKFIGQSDEVAELSGVLAMWLMPLHFCFAFQLPMSRFLLSQLKTQVIAWASFVSLVVNVLTSWIVVYVLDFGVVGLVVALDISWWVLFFGLFGYTIFGGCPLTWTGFSMQAFSGLREFVKLSVSSRVMLCLENWYYRILLLMTGYLKNVTSALDALSICMKINGWEMTIHLAFFAATGVRVANELGAGNGKGAKFATKVSVMQSIIVGLFFCLLIMLLREKVALIFTTNADVLKEFEELSNLLAITILFNSVQPVLSGVAMGSGWQAKVAYINLGCYYLIGLPLGFLLGWLFHWGVMGIWGGMIFGGTAVQTVILAIITVRTDWEKEAEKASHRVQKWSIPKSDNQPQVEDLSH